MGARTTWKIVSDKGAALWLYSHWGGDDKFADTQRALAAAMPRRYDITYATRIFVSNIIGDNWNQETGFGLAATKESAPNPFEESYYDAVIDFVNQSVILGNWKWKFDQFLTAECPAELLGEFDLTT